MTLYSFPGRQDFAQFVFTRRRGDWVAARQPLGFVANLDSMPLAWNMVYFNLSPAQMPSYRHFPKDHSWTKFSSIKDLQGVVLFRRIEWTLASVCLQYTLCKRTTTVVKRLFTSRLNSWGHHSMDHAVLMLAGNRGRRPRFFALVTRFLM